MKTMKDQVVIITGAAGAYVIAEMIMLFFKRALNELKT